MSLTQAFEIPLIKATNESLKRYGYLIDSCKNSDIEIVTLPKQGWREIDKGTAMKEVLRKVLLTHGGIDQHFMVKTMLCSTKVFFQLMKKIHLWESRGRFMLE